MSPEVALSGESQGGEFTSAFGGVAEVHGRTASAASEAYDPPATLAVHCGNDFGCQFQPLSKYSFEPIQCCSLSLGADMWRRQFINLLGGAAAWPLAARAQQHAPVIGFVYTGQTSSGFVTAFRQGLLDAGFVEGQNVAVEYRSPGGENERLRAVVAELLDRQVAVIVGNTPPALAAKMATSTVPIVFFTGTDPVKLGLVASFNRPGGNATGVSFLASDLDAKRLGLLRDLVPRVTMIGALVDPKFLTSASQLQAVQEAARALGLTIHVIQASTEVELDNAFDTLAQERRPLIVIAAPFFTAQRNQIVERAARHSLPAMYDVREFPAAGGLMSYGTSLLDALHQVGVYAGRILKGENAVNLPVLQPTKFEFVINLKTAKALGIEVPISMQLLADEVIE
jgi:putative tryptophan/tyrosine transport system substrate-binding protein